MKFKKMMPFIFAILMLLVTISIPYFMLIVQDYSLLNKTVVDNIDNSSLENKTLTIKEKLELICNNAYDDKKNIYKVKGDNFNFVSEMNDEQINALYEEIKVLRSLNGITEISKNDMKNYYECLITLYKADDVIVSISQLSFKSNNIYIDLWFDSDTYKIYQYQMTCKEEKGKFKELTAVEAFMKYLGLTEKEYDSYYSLTMTKYSLYIDLDKTYSHFSDSNN